MNTIEKDIILILTSSAFSGVIATLAGVYSTYLNHKDKTADRKSELKKLDTEDYFTRWNNAENEIDELRDQIRDLKDNNSRLKLQLQERNQDENTKETKH